MSREPDFSFSITADKYESDESVHARVTIDPSFQASATIKAFDQSIGNLAISSLHDHLNRQIADIHSNELKTVEALLVSQAVALDGIFHSLSRRAICDSSNLERFERLLRLGLKAQSQSRATLETLGKIKNPQPIAFVKQANIAHGHQQVNNGVATCAERNGSAPNELLEIAYEEWLDTRATCPTGAVDSLLVAVESSVRAGD